MGQNDYELIYMAKEKNEEALNILYDKYNALIEKKAREYYRLVSNKGVDLNDFIQEAMIGFEEAINYFDEKNDTLFYTFMNICVERQLKSLLSKLNRNKHKILNDSVSLDYLYDNDETLLNFYRDNDDNNPEKGLINNETEKELYSKIILQLNDAEKEVFDLKIKGFSYSEISDILNKDLKLTANILYRIRLKVKKIINNE